MERAILHLDGDSFFASVEIAKNPELRGKPVVTGGERGIASSMSYEAKALGITRGMPVFQIRKFFPEVIVVSSDYESYAMFSQRMIEIVRRYAPMVEEYSIDECFADITGVDARYKVSYRDIMERIQHEIEYELNISVSLGLASTKVLAKVASKIEKPHGVVIIEDRDRADYLKKTPVGKVWGIGWKTSKKLIMKRINTAYDFASLSEAYIEKSFAKPVLEIWHELNGRSLYKIHTESTEDAKSISKVRTFHPSTSDPKFLLAELSRNIESACHKARRYHLMPKEVGFYLKTSEFAYQGESIKLPRPTHNPNEIIKAIEESFYKIFNSRYKYRATGIHFSNLVPEDAFQPDLFGESSKSFSLSSVFQVVDSIISKYGRHALFLGSSKRAVARYKTLDKDTRERTLVPNIADKKLNPIFLGEIS